MPDFKLYLISQTLFTLSNNNFGVLVLIPARSERCLSRKLYFINRRDYARVNWSASRCKWLHYLNTMDSIALLCTLDLCSIVIICSPFVRNVLLSYGALLYHSKPVNESSHECYFDINDEVSVVWIYWKPHFLFSLFTQEPMVLVMVMVFKFKL